MTYYTYTDFLAKFGIGGAHPGGLSLTKTILEELSIDQNTLLLEVGCGTGQTTSFISSHYPCRLYAIDNHPLMINKVRNRLLSTSKDVEILEAHTEKLPFKEDMFHYILSESVTVFSNIKQSLQEYVRILKKDGELILIELTKSQNLHEDEVKELIHFYNFTQLLSESEWITLLNENGFNNVRVFSIDLDLFHGDNLAFTEFDISEKLDQQLFDMLDKHEFLNQKYKKKIGFRVFICKKQ